MLQTVEAEINRDGSIRLLEPLYVSKTSRALVIVLDAETPSVTRTSNAKEVLKFLRENPLPENARPSADAIEAHIAEARESWD